MLDFTPLVERASIDEMYLDFTGCESLYQNDLPGLMKRLQRLVWDEFTLPCTIALASNKTVAKIAAGTVKPAGVCTVPHGSEKQFLAPLPVEVLPGVGAKTLPVLNARGITTVADLQRQSAQALTGLLGEWGSYFFDIANGNGPEHLTLEWERKSISREETFSEDLADFIQLAKLLHGLVEDVCSSVRAKRWKARTITLKLRFADFRTITRAVSIHPTDDDSVVYDAACGLLAKEVSHRRRFRLLGVRLTNFIEREDEEMSLFHENGKRSEMLDAMDKLREKFGDDVIHLGGG